MKVAVIGGGVVGLCCAYALRREGADVLLLERDEIGSGASRGNTGWVVPTLSTPLASPGILKTGLQSAFDPHGTLVIKPTLDMSWIRWLWRFWRSARPETFSFGVRALLALNEPTFDELDEYRSAGVQFEMHSTGILVVGQKREELAWFQTLFDEVSRLGQRSDLEILSGLEARAIEPALSDLVAAAMRTNLDRYVSPESLMQGLAEYLITSGAAIQLQAKVTGLAPVRGGWRICTPAGDVDADAVVLATGAAINQLLRPLGVNVPVVGAKGIR